MEKGVLKYGEYDGEQSEPIRVDRDRESQTRVKKHAEKAEKIRVSTINGVIRRHIMVETDKVAEALCSTQWHLHQITMDEL